MDIYTLLRPLLFRLDAEKAHHLTMAILKSPLFKLYPAASSQITFDKELFGLNFCNPVGLAAGLDKNGEAIDSFAQLGFGFIEIGTVTPKPQDGNPSPRLFRLKNDEAIINRMGFNNLGVAQVAKNLSQRKSSIIVGGNIGKNKITPNEFAAKDYEICFKGLHDLVDYFVVNVSSPNTPGLRELQDKSFLTRLFSELQNINHGQKKAKPILLKIAPDLSLEQLNEIAELFQEIKIDGIVATNTTISREKLPHYLPSEIDYFGAGGLSGKPLTARSTEVIDFLKRNLPDQTPIVGVGGIMTPADAVSKMNAGADLLQLYSGFIYKGPALINEILQAIKLK